MISVASSHQISTSNRPSVPAQLVTKATTIASEMRVIIPGWRARQLALRAAQEDEAAVEEDDRAEDRRHVARCRGTSGPRSRDHPAMSSLSRTTGIVSARLSQNLSRNIATEWPACVSWDGGAASWATCAAGCEAWLLWSISSAVAGGRGASADTPPQYLSGVKTCEDVGAMDPIATFPTLDDAESALDWIGVDFGEGDGAFEGELAGDDRELLEAASRTTRRPRRFAISPARCSRAGTPTPRGRSRSRLGGAPPGDHGPPVASDIVRIGRCPWPRSAVQWTPTAGWEAASSPRPSPWARKRHWRERASPDRRLLPASVPGHAGVAAERRIAPPAPPRDADHQRRLAGRGRAPHAGLRHGPGLPHRRDPAARGGRPRAAQPARAAGVPRPVRGRLGDRRGDRDDRVPDRDLPAAPAVHRRARGQRDLGRPRGIAHLRARQYCPRRAVLDHQRRLVLRRADAAARRAARGRRCGRTSPAS